MDIASLFSKQPPPLLGLDISATSIKLVELGRDREGRLTLERWAHEPLERDWVSDGNIENFDQVAEALRRVIKKSGTRTRLAAMALPPSAVITKKIILPGGLSEADLEVQVEIEANQYIPFSLDEVSLDFCVLGPSHANAGDVEVLIAASRREKVQDRQGLAEAAGLKPHIVDVETFAARLAAGRLIDSLPISHENRENRDGRDVHDPRTEALVALFEIGSHATRLQVLRGGEALYDRDQLFGGAQLTQLIARQYGLTPEEAEQRKRSGELPEDYPAAVLRPFVDSLGQEIARSLQFFFTSTPHNRVDHVLLAGGSASLPGLPETVAAHTSFPSSVADPFEGMALAAGARGHRLRQDAPGYLTACGLAMRRFAW